MHEMVTTALDVVALLAVAAGVYFAAAPWIGAAALAPAGLVVGGASAWWASRARARDGVQR
jgi:hypothetical protein